MTKYTEKDAEKDTKTSIKYVSKNWHKAKGDAKKEPDWGVPQDRHGNEQSSGNGKKDI